MKYFIKPQKYIYLESTCPDLYNDEIYQISRFTKFLIFYKLKNYLNDLNENFYAILYRNILRDNAALLGGTF